jgi:hypothetical protein
VRSKDQLIAYAGFLLSEKLRHEDDIKMINRKLHILECKGIKADKPGDWITEEELEVGFC